MHSSSALYDLLSLIYGAGVKVRNILYDSGVLKSYRAPLLVVSVGNIEAGGTGKTPFTMALAEGLSRRGLKTAIVTRGYKGTLKGPVRVAPNHLIEEVGDEALLMARLVDLPVIKSPDRVKGALFAHVHLGSDIIILDDGFQHRRLRRDMDIVLVSRDITREKLLPAGMLREPAASLRRADVIVAMKGSLCSRLKADLKPMSFVDLQGEEAGLELIKGKRVLAFCAIGRPEHFFAGLEGLGAQVERLAYKDHHRYSMADVREIMDHASGSDLILTTEKDLVKIDPKWFAGLEKRIFVVKAGIEMTGLEGILDEIEHMAGHSRIL
ncbi:MAG TPA: tetraacyldisaccharide 4'-kinase [Desulfomonilia bacterium]|nr:tetraacyldisaccharide 4'-kinase [Desulfomonilia bacterium]